ncbi:hypothetical protein [Micromonospora palomenae]|uniref:hypothetical protein n=1 Tax=Micromonospora palomenae TaxID=1461247 RepID=UPI003F8BE008
MPPTLERFPSIIRAEEEEEEGDDGLENVGAVPTDLPASDSPYWSTDDGGEEEEE